MEGHPALVSGKWDVWPADFPASHVMLSCTAACVQDKLATLGDWRRLQEAQLGLGCVCLGVLACVTLALTINVRAAARERRVW